MCDACVLFDRKNGSREGVCFTLGDDFEEDDDGDPLAFPGLDAFTTAVGDNLSDACSRQSQGYDSNSSRHHHAHVAANAEQQQQQMLGSSDPCAGDVGLMDLLGDDLLAGDSSGYDSDADTMHRLMANSYSLDEPVQCVPSDPQLLSTLQDAFTSGTSLSNIMRLPPFGAHPLSTEAEAWQSQWRHQEQAQAQHIQEAQPQIQPQQHGQQQPAPEMAGPFIKMEAASPAASMASSSNTSSSSSTTTTAATDKLHFSQRETRRQREKRMREVNKRNQELRQQLAMAQGTLDTAASLLYDMWSTDAFDSNSTASTANAPSLQ